MGSPCVLHHVYAADLAANPSHSPPLIGEARLSTLADEQAPVGANKKEQITIAIIVLVALRPQSTPA
jgi:hypothetical protein